MTQTQQEFHRNSYFLTQERYNTHRDVFSDFTLSIIIRLVLTHRLQNCINAYSTGVEVYWTLLFLSVPQSHPMVQPKVQVFKKLPLFLVSYELHLPNLKKYSQSDLLMRAIMQSFLIKTFILSHQSFQTYFCQETCTYS